MKFKEFMDALDGDIKNVYLLSGEETFFIDKAREKILARLGVDKQTELITFDCDTKPALGEIISAIDSSPFFSPKNVVLVKNATFFSADKKIERLENILQDMQPTNYVIFTAKTADKRRKLYKIISQVGAILEANPLRSWEVDEWLNEKLSSLGKIMRGEARRHFNERLGILPEISLWYLENELNKVALNVTGNEITAADLRKNMLAPPEVSNFALTDAVDERKVKKAFYLLKQQARIPAKIPLVMTLLVNHVRRLIRAKFFMAQGITGRRLGEPLEMNPYIAQKFSEVAKTYSEKLLEETFIELAEADFKLKTGRADIEILERILIKLCKR
ncbi:MAG: DNA polymerase III subunit delta [Selenomonadaceae bacterium]|nr:DNA polymerase III subunit delta [Selenomonadaceae bacterium]